MVKHFCDRCGKEIKGNNFGKVYYERAVGYCNQSTKMEEIELCEYCNAMFKEFIDPKDCEGLNK